MKRQALTVLSTTIFLVMLAVGTVHADPGRQVRAEVPFDFMVGNKAYPAGTYAVKYTDPQGVLVVQIGEDDRRRTLLWSNTAPAQPIQDHSPRLIFNRYGEQYFLTQVWAGRDIGGRALRKFHGELELAQEYLAKNVSLPEVVSIAAVVQSLPVELAGWLLDGSNSTSVIDSALRAEATRGYRVVTNSFSAEYGMTAGGQLTSVSKWELKILF